MSPRIENLPGMVGRHPSMLAVYRLVRKAAPTDLAVLIVGETGTGKELVARALHTLRPAPIGPFIDVNCAALPESLAEAQLFGWERGAYTGANQRGMGLLEQADGGTLFLDEVGSMPLALQAKLLRAIEHKEFRRLGGRGVVRSRFRVVAAVAEPGHALVACGRLRRDLEYRLAGVEIALPPLRARGGDVLLLANHFLNARNGHPARAFVDDTPALLRRHQWPGNVRELKAAVERVALLTESTSICGAVRELALATEPAGMTTREDLELALEAAGGSVRAAARSLGIPRSTLRDRLVAAGVELTK